MKQIIKIELTKILSYNVFRIIILLHFVLYFLVILIPSRLDITVPGFSTDYLFQFPHIWEFFPWVASWFNIILAILIIILTTNEYSFQTFRQHAINGLSRFQLLSGKGFVLLMMAVYATLIVFLSTLIFGFVFTKDISSTVLFQKSYILLVYFIQSIAYMVVGFLIAVLFRNTALSIVLFMLYRVIIEPVLRQFFPKQVRLYFPMKIISNLTPTPEFLSISTGNQSQNPEDIDTLSLREIGLLPTELPMITNLMLTIAYTALFIYLAYLLLKKRNL